MSKDLLENNKIQICVYGNDPVTYNVERDTHPGLRLIGQILGCRTAIQALAALNLRVDQSALDSLATIYTEAQSRARES